MCVRTMAVCIDMYDCATIPSVQAGPLPPFQQFHRGKTTSNRFEQVSTDSCCAGESPYESNKKNREKTATRNIRRSHVPFTVSSTHSRSLLLPSSFAAHAVFVHTCPDTPGWLNNPLCLTRAMQQNHCVCVCVVWQVFVRGGQ